MKDDDNPYDKVSLAARAEAILITVQMDDVVDKYLDTSRYSLYASTPGNIIQQKENGLTDEMIAHGFALPVEEVTKIVTDHQDFSKKMKLLRVAAEEWSKKNGIDMDGYLIGRGR